MVVLSADIATANFTSCVLALSSSVVRFEPNGKSFDFEIIFLTAKDAGNKM